MGHLTLAFVLQTVLPLMAILLGFSAFSGEREQGTLPQLLSLGVRPVHLLLGKGLAAAGVLLGLLALASGGLAAGLSLFGAHHLAEVEGDGLRLAGMALGYALYLIGFLALALAVSARGRSSRSALVGLLVFWLLNSFLVPRLGHRRDPERRPPPHRAGVPRGDRRGQEAALRPRREPPRLHRLPRPRPPAIPGKAVEDLPVNFRGLSLCADDEAGYRIFDRHFGRLQSQIERQDAWRSLAGFLFPMLALQPVSMAMAGTDNRHHHHFVRAAEQHRRLIQTATSQDLIDHAKNGDNNYVAPESTWAHPVLRLPPARRWLGVAQPVA